MKTAFAAGLTACLLLAAGASHSADADAVGEDALPSGPDVDLDGFVSLEEFKAFRWVQALASDDDGDGVLDLGEFREMLPSRVPRPMHRRIFSRVDADGDDRVDEQEMSAMPVRVFDEADADGDGRLDAGELATLQPAQ